jgi:diguanylate cyclase (GGDEF)-like protein
VSADLDGAADSAAVGVRHARADEVDRDPVTGLFNRPYVSQALQVAMAASLTHAVDNEGDGVGEASSGGRREVGADGPSLLVLDLDGFKGVNDVAGHAAGDDVLRMVAARLVEITGPDAVLARLGGDEFAVVLADVTRAQAVLQAERIAHDVARSYAVAGGSFVIGASIGIAHGADVCDPEDLLRNADLAMYAAKGTRRAVRTFEPSMHTAAVLRADRDLVHAAALDEGRTELYFQPIVTLDTGQPVGVEALLKWRTEDGALGDSGALLEYAERSGRMGALSGWVIATALDQVADWRDELGLIPVSVNLPPVDLLRRGLVSSLRQQLTTRGLPASVLTLEITEQVLMQDPDRAIRVITDLRSLGLRVSIDDFGTGFSSLAYLVDLPVDALKIDSSFIQALPRTRTARVIVSGIIDMARQLDLVVIAEGIETVEQRELLLALGDPLGQGYLFSPPVPAAEAAARIEAAREAQPNLAPIFPPRAVRRSPGGGGSGSRGSGSGFSSGPDPSERRDRGPHLETRRGTD